MRTTSPWPALSNLKWERFAREYASGESLTSAYVKAGYANTRNARFNASRLANKPPVRARINELMEQFAEQSALKVQYVQHQLLPVLRANPQDLFDSAGRLKSITDLPREVAAGIKSIEFDRKTGQVAKITITDKVSAGSALLRSLGIGPDVAVTAIAAASASAEAKIGAMSASEVARRISWIIEQAAAESASPDGGPVEAK